MDFDNADLAMICGAIIVVACLFAPGDHTTLISSITTGIFALARVRV